MSVRIPELAPWTGCTDCAGGPQPGASAFLAFWLEAYPGLATSMGIYACRNVRGSSSRSVHACGRAIDCGVPVTEAGHRAMYEFLGKLAPHAKRLGITLVIFDRTIWSARRDAGGERYTGVHPHEDHAHVELSPKAAQQLTLATLRAVVGDLRGSDAPAPPKDQEPADPGATLSRAQLVGALPTVNLSARRPDVRGDQVRTLQSLLGVRGHPAANSYGADGQPDGHGGPGTRAALGRAQARKRTGRPSSPASPDYIAGPATWTALVGTVRTLRFDRGTVRGTVVGTVQALLAARGHPPARSFPRKGRPDAIGGAGTRNALAAFQRATGSGAPDGSADLIVGPKTWAALLDV